MTGAAELVVRFAPVAGLVLAFPVVLGALTGERTIDEALLALLVGVVAAAVGLHLWGMATRPAPPPPDSDPDPDSAP